MGRRSPREAEDRCEEDKRRSESDLESHVRGFTQSYPERNQETPDITRASFLLESSGGTESRHRKGLLSPGVTSTKWTDRRKTREDPVEGEGREEYSRVRIVPVMIREGEREEPFKEWVMVRVTPVMREHPSRTCEKPFPSAIIVIQL